MSCSLPGACDDPPPLPFSPALNDYFDILIYLNMYKQSYTVILPCLLNLFNVCFSYSYYPESWANRYITPIFKSNDPSDPNNYRGITITSNLGKLFNNVLNTKLDNF